MLEFPNLDKSAAATANTPAHVHTAAEIIIRPYEATDAAHVQRLFVRAHRTFTLPALLAALFENYIALALSGEINRITEYYGDREGRFWVAISRTKIVGMFGLVPSRSAKMMELRRVCVEPDARRQGIGRKMLEFAEQYCREQNIGKIEFSTSEFHREALSLYCILGYQPIREELVETLAGVVRTFYFCKQI